MLANSLTVHEWLIKSFVRILLLNGFGLWEPSLMSNKQNKTVSDFFFFALVPSLTVLAFPDLFLLEILR